jgi:hypothetical protein
METKELNKDEIKVLKKAIIRKVWTKQSNKQLMVTIPIDNALGIVDGDEVVIQKLK